MLLTKRYWLYKSYLSDTTFFKYLCSNSKCSNKYIRVTIIFIYYYINNEPSSGIFQIRPNNLFDSCSLIKLDFLPLHTIYFDKNMTLPLFVIMTIPIFYWFIGFYFLLFFFNTSNNIIPLSEYSLNVSINYLFFLNLLFQTS